MRLLFSFFDSLRIPHSPGLSLSSLCSGSNPSLSLSLSQSLSLSFFLSFCRSNVLSESDKGILSLFCISVVCKLKFSCDLWQLFSLGAEAFLVFSGTASDIRRITAAGKNYAYVQSKKATPFGIDVDFAENRVYWVDRSTNRISRQFYNVSFTVSLSDSALPIPYDFTSI